MVLETSIGSNVESIADELKRKLGGKAPVALLVFSSIHSDFTDFVPRLKSFFPTIPLLGATSGGGQFVKDGFSTKDFVAGVIGSEDDVEVDSLIIEGLKETGRDSIQKTFSRFYAKSGEVYSRGFKHYTVLLMSDAFAIDGDTLVNLIREHAGLQALLAGGLAGDDFQMKKTYVFHGDRVYTDALCALAIYSKKSLGIGVKHGGIAYPDKLEITKCNGNILYELNGKPALEVWKEILSKNGVEVNPDNPILTIILYELGIPSIEKEMTVRAPLQMLEDGGIAFAGQLPAGRKVRIMKMTEGNMVNGAEESIREAMSSIDGEPGGGILFSCAARLNSMEDYKKEVEHISHTLNTPLIGFNTYGEIGRQRGKFVGFHNTTLVSVALPRA
jgi:hypothetical protein